MKKILEKDNKLSKQTSKSYISNRCVNTINKKKFNNLTHYSRIVFLKLVRNKNIYGLNKTSW
jgi:ribosomal protein S14